MMVIRTMGHLLEKFINSVLLYRMCFFIYASSGDRARFPLGFRHRQTGMRTVQTPKRKSRCGGKVQKNCILQSDILLSLQTQKTSDMNKV